MKILIGITSKNRAKILPTALDSALSQSYINKEVWVYDDASTDDTKKLQSKYPNVKWITGTESKGLVFARNFFMKQDGFDYFCSLDDDAWFISEDSIDTALNYLINNSDVGALGFDMLSPDSPDKHTVFSYFSYSNNFIGCGHIINLNAAKKINYYSQNPGYYGGEEKDFCIRLIDASYKIVTYKGNYVWHDKTNIARDLEKQHQSGVCNDLVFIYRRAPLFLLIPALIIKIFKHLKFSITYKRAKLIKPCFKGILDFWKWVFRKNKSRKAVSLTAFKKFIELGKH